MRVLRSPVDTLSCALFPAPCCACGSPLLHFSRAPVCDACWKSLEPLQNICCALCGEDLGTGSRSLEALSATSEPVCHLCSKVPPPFRRAVACGTYRATLRALIHSLKYEGILPIADPLGKRLAQTILMLEPAMRAEGSTSILMVPVPSHGSNRRFRHADLIARAALRELRAIKPDWKLTLAPTLLERQRATESQAGLTPHQRRINVRGAFSAPEPAAVRDAQVLLIDDIYTTGATARACTKALLKAGAASVWVATVARAQFEHIARPQQAAFDEVEEDPELPPPDLPMEEDVAFWGTADRTRQIVH